MGPDSAENPGPGRLARNWAAAVAPTEASRAEGEGPAVGQDMEETGDSHDVGPVSASDPPTQWAVVTTPTAMHGRVAWEGLQELGRGVSCGSPPAGVLSPV